MTIQTINIGATPNDNTGDDPRTAGQKLNSNFTTSTHAASRDVGTASGNVMEVGAFGLGTDSTPYIGAGIDADTLTVTGTYYGSFNNAPKVITAWITVDASMTVSGRVKQTWLASESELRYVRSQTSPGTWSDWTEIYHSGNLNPNVFGGVGSSDFLMWGWAEDANTAVFEARIFGLTAPASITQQGFFNIFRPAGFSSVAASVSVTIAGSSSPNSIVVVVSGLSGLTAGEALLLYTVNATSKITVNF